MIHNKTMDSLPGWMEIDTQKNCKYIHLFGKKFNFSNVFVITSRHETLEDVCVPEGTILIICKRIGLKSLIGCPAFIKGIYCCQNEISSLEGIPDGLTMLDISHNPITNWDGFHRLNFEYLNVVGTTFHQYVQVLV